MVSVQSFPIHGVLFSIFSPFLSSRRRQWWLGMNPALSLQVTDSSGVLRILFGGIHFFPVAQRHLWMVLDKPVLHSKLAQEESVHHHHVGVWKAAPGLAINRAAVSFWSVQRNYLTYENNSKLQFVKGRREILNKCGSDCSGTVTL